MNVSHWFLQSISSNDSLLAVFLMWLNTEFTYAFMVAFFLLIEKSGQFTKFKIHPQLSDMQMMKVAICFKPIAWLVDVPIYFLSFRMMSWRTITRLWCWWMSVSSSASSSSTCTTNHYIPAPSPLDPLPDAKVLFQHVLILTLVFDLLFYMWHRALHTKLLWPYHKKHHEVKVSFSCANDHESVVELGGNILWKMIPPAFIGCHVYTVCVFRAIVKFFALVHHSGFELPLFQPLQSIIPGVASPSYHDFHHYYGHGNFGGVFMIWDYIFGTHKKVTKIR